MKRAPHLTPPRKALLVYQKKRMMKKIPLQVLITMVHRMTLRRREKKGSESVELSCNTPTLVEQDPFNAHKQSRAPMDTGSLGASGEDAIDVDREKKDCPAIPITTNPVQVPSSKNPFNRGDRLGLSLALQRFFRPMPPPSAPRSLDGHLASLERHDTASVESKDSAASKAKTDDMTPHKVLRSAFAPHRPRLPSAVKAGCLRLQA